MRPLRRNEYSQNYGGFELYSLLTQHTRKAIEEHFFYLERLMKSFELKGDKEYTIFEYSSDGEKPEDDATCKVLKFTIPVSKTTFRDLGWTVEVVPK